MCALDEYDDDEDEEEEEAKTNKKNNILFLGSINNAIDKKMRYPQQIESGTSNTILMNVNKCGAFCFYSFFFCTQQKYRLQQKSILFGHSFISFIVFHTSETLFTKYIYISISVLINNSFFC